MSNQVLFYKCPICHNIIEFVSDERGMLVCCGQPMEKLTANTQEASVEKHIPVATTDGHMIEVIVGSTAHPMIEAHYIEWIIVTDGKTSQRVQLTPTDEPKATFAHLENASVYAYCNLHGLWEGVVDHVK